MKIMVIRQKKQREKINFKSIRINRIIKYMPAANEVISAIISYNNCILPAFIKVERSKRANFISEIKNINIINNNSLYGKIPLIYESGKINDKNYIVLEKMSGKLLSEIFSKSIKNKDEYLFKYGRELALVHLIEPKKFENACERNIYKIPSAKRFNLKEKEIQKHLKFILKNKPKFNNNTFIHGDFHYGNILWKNGRIFGIIDWEYSGKGFKELDIALALIYRNNQKFMTSKKDMKIFLNGYKKIGSYDSKALKWCLINGYLHFYLMTKNIGYKTRLLKMMNIVINLEL